MGFSTSVFMFGFLPTAIILYAIFSRGKNVQTQNIVLLVLSIFFYAWCGIQYLFLIFVLIIINYIATRHLKNKYALFWTVSFNLFALGIFKYFDFIVENIERLLSFVSGTSVSLPVPTAPLPLGISFIAFSLIAYAVDIYRGELPETKFIDFSLFVMLFPKVVEGPIARYHEMRGSLKERRVESEQISLGVRRFIRGFAKKVLLADRLAVVSDAIFTQSPICLTVQFAWLGAITYAFVIFFDFSGYSDMAIGLCQIFGFHIGENFDYPYIAKSVQEFWRRWHISLSSWFRDYVYIPLGGNRNGTLCTYRNLAIVFLLTGLWHGASWNFIVWGCFHGAFQLLERWGLKKALKRLPDIFRHIYLLLVVVVGWVFFRADNLAYALSYISTMFFFGEITDTANEIVKLTSLEIQKNITPAFVFLFIVSAFLSTPFVKTVSRKVKTNSAGIDVAVNVFYIALFLVSVSVMVSSSYAPSIYMKF